MMAHVFLAHALSVHGPAFRPTAARRAATVPRPAWRRLSVSLRPPTQRSPGARTHAWASDTAVHDDQSIKKQDELIAKFKAADTDGNGVIDREELWTLLESTAGGMEASMDDGQHWLTEDEVDRVMRQYDPTGSGALTFEQFSKLCADGILLDGKLDEYRVAFDAVDNGGNGRISATEIAQLFQQLGSPLSYDRMVRIMAKYDVDHSGQIEFPEFLRMFRDELLDLQEILEYIKMQPTEMSPDEKKALTNRAGPGLVAGTVNMLFSEAELDAALQQAGEGKLVVLMASLTWCRPCKAFGPSYEKLANRYENVACLKFNGNENDDTKHMFKDRLKARVTPTFYFFRNGKQVHCHTGANKARLEYYIREKEAARVGAEALPKQLYATYTPNEKEPVGSGV